MGNIGHILMKYNIGPFINIKGYKNTRMKNRQAGDAISAEGGKNF